MAYKGSANKALAGLRPLKNKAGTAPEVHEYDVAVAYGVAIGEGCLLIKTATGVELAADAAAVTAGVVVGVAAANLGATIVAGTKIKVFDDPEQEFSVIGDAVITATATLIAATGRFIGMTVNTNVYDSTYESGIVTVETGTIASPWTTSLPLQILGYADEIGDSSAAANYPIKVKIAKQHHFQTSQASGSDARP